MIDQSLGISTNPRVVWIGPLSTDPEASRARDVCDYVLRPRCEDLGVILSDATLTGAENWLTYLLAQLRTARGVVCDLSGERCNVYFELGYTIALGLPVLLICRKGTRVHVDLANFQRHEYADLHDAEPVIREWLSTLRMLHEDALLGLYASVPHPFRILEGDGQHEYLNDPRIARRPFPIRESSHPPLTLESAVARGTDFSRCIFDIHQLQTQIAARTGRPFFNASLLGYVYHTPIRDESGLKLGAEIFCRETDYFAFVASHYPVEGISDAEGLGLLDRKQGSALRDRVLELRESGLWEYAQPLTATVYLLVTWPNGRRLYFQNRDTSRNFHARFPKQATAAGMIHGSRVVDQSGDATLAPEIAFLHELCEEAGIRAERKDVRLLGFVQEEAVRECGFVGYVVADPAMLDRRKLPMDKFESDPVLPFESVQMAPDALASYLKHRAEGGRAVVPLALAGLALLLIHEFGLQTAVEVFRKGAANRVGG